MRAVDAWVEGVAGQGGCGLGAASSADALIKQMVFQVLKLACAAAVGAPSLGPREKLGLCTQPPAPAPTLLVGQQRLADGGGAAAGCIAGHLAQRLLHNRVHLQGAGEGQLAWLIWLLFSGKWAPGPAHRSAHAAHSTGMLES